MQDVPPVHGPVRGALYLGVQEVREAERVHHDERLRESALQSTAGGPAPPGAASGGLGPAHPAHPRRRPTTHPSPQLSGSPQAAPASGRGLRKDTHARRGGQRGRPTCTAPMAITHMQNKKMPRGTSGKVTIKENCSQKTQSAAFRPTDRRPPAERAGGGGRGPGDSSLQSSSVACLS